MTAAFGTKSGLNTYNSCYLFYFKQTDKHSLLKKYLNHKQQLYVVKYSNPTQNKRV